MSEQALNEINFQFPILGSRRFEMIEIELWQLTFNSLYWVPILYGFESPLKCIVTFNSLYWVRYGKIPPYRKYVKVFQFPILGSGLLLGAGIPV